MKQQLFLYNEEKQNTPISIQNIISEEEKLYNKATEICYGTSPVSRWL